MAQRGGGGGGRRGGGGGGAKESGHAVGNCPMTITFNGLRKFL